MRKKIANVVALTIKHKHRGEQATDEERDHPSPSLSFCVTAAAPLVYLTPSMA